MLSASNLIYLRRCCSHKKELNKNHFNRTQKESELSQNQVVDGAVARTTRRLSINKKIIDNCLKSRRKFNSPYSLLLATLLPFIIILLLPIFKLEQATIHDGELLIGNQFSSPANDNNWSQHLLLRGFLLPLIKFPFDRLRLVTTGLVTSVSAKEINSKHDLQEEETHLQLIAPAEHRSVPYGGYVGGANQGPRGPTNVDYGGGGGPEQAEGPGMGPVEGTAVSEPQVGGTVETRNDLPAVRALNVKCEKNHMTVNIVFDRPFYGTVFSKGHYNDQKCVHLPANSGQSSVNFDIHLGKCGMSSSEGHNALQSQPNQQQPNGLYIENTIIIQYDPQVQEIYDQARKLRCTWYDYYEKSVTFRPYNVDMLDAVTANFLGDNIQCWMQIQVGKGPWSSEVAGIVKIGQTMTMVLAIKDDENRFDMLVRNCVAHDGKHQPIQLVDEYGCVARPKIMGKFQKVRNFGSAATVVSYAHFQAFKFPDSMSVHFQCVIQVCRHECPEPVCSGQSSGALSGPAEGPAAIGNNAASGADYAASGTEIVASKELVPPHATSNSYYATNRTIQPGSASVNLKLDESQGRVQVKLDTSMMAGSGRLPSGGPLPPHLLHSSGETPAGYAAPAGRQSSSYYRQPTGGASSTRSTLPATSNRYGPQVAPSGGPQAQHFSVPYPTGAHRSYAGSAYTNRLGELLASSELSEQQATSTSASNSMTDTSPLALLGSPRALRTAPSVVARTLPNNHRLRRSVAETRDSTNIRTQKTIQVVSPDDVAFSLLSPGEHFEATKQVRDDQLSGSTVCVSSSRLMLAILVTLVSLAASIVIIVYFVLKQRARLEDKLAASFQYEPADELQREHEILRQQAALSRSHEEELISAATLAAAAAQQQRRRQQQEIQQRNKYLARLYSQFVPTAYWKQ